MIHTFGAIQKTGYHIPNKNEDTSNLPLAAHPDIARDIWRLNVAPKIKHFLWRVAYRAIAVNANLRHRRINADRLCSCCCAHEETSDHVFFSCYYAEIVWQYI